MKKACVVVINWNLRDLLKKCLNSLKKTSYSNLEILVVDNGSEDGSVEMVEREFPDVWLIKNSSNLGFVKAANQGIDFAFKKLKVDYVVVSNNDVEYTQKDWLKKLIKIAESRKSIGRVSCISFKPDGEMEDTIIKVTPLYEIHEKMNSELMEVGDKRLAADTGVLKREVFEKIGGFDENFLIIGGEVEDYLIRMKRAGFKALRTSKVKFLHHSGASTKNLPSLSLYFAWTRNKIYFSALNLPWHWVFGRLLLYFLAIFLRTENGHIMLRKKEKKERYLLFTKALFWNLRKFKEILRKRFNRTMKIDIVAEK